MGKLRGSPLLDVTNGREIEVRFENNQEEEDDEGE